ncbi:hypothetical protein EZS27_003873, partial [termite gut metagenome]
MASKAFNYKDYIGLVGNELQKATLLGIESKREALKGKSYQKVLTELLTQIGKVNFRERAGLDEDVKMSRKLYVVIAIDEIIGTAISHNWGLCTKDGFTYVFNGKYWQVVNLEDFKTFLAGAAIQMGVPILEAKYHLFKDELSKQFLSAANLPTLEVGENTLINLANGTFEITKDKPYLREQRREDFIKYQLPFEFNPQAK